MSATIGGSLPFQGPPSATSYTQQYQVALAQNQANYNNILSGYQSTQQAQEAAQQGIQQGYATLSTNVLNTIQGISASQQQQINDVYSQNSGAAAQDLINRGLGNTTVANSVQRGMLSDQQKASINLSNQTAGLTAGYQSNLGLAGLNYANQANMQNTGLKTDQLRYMASQQMPYPQPRQNMPMGGGGGGGNRQMPNDYGLGAFNPNAYNPGPEGGATYDSITPAQYGYAMRPTTGGPSGGPQQPLNIDSGNQGTPQYFPAFASQVPYSQPGSGYVDQSSAYTQPGGDATQPAQDYYDNLGMSANEASGAMDQGEGDDESDYEEPEQDNEDYGDTENDYDTEDEGDDED